MTNNHGRFSDFGIRSRNTEELDINSTNPYTPRQERLRFSFSESVGEELNVLINRRWKVYKVSPLNCFSYREIKLKQYARRLREGLATLATGIGNAKYDVTFGVERDLTETQHDKQAIKIEVNLIPHTRNEDEENSPKMFYLGYLISRGASRPLEDVSMTHLPLLLCNGTVVSHKNIHFLMQKFFDCSISPLELTQEDLIWISAFIAQEEAQTVEFNFKFPQISVKNGILCKMAHTNLETLWKIIHDPESEYISYKEIKLFQSALLEQFTVVFGIDFGQALLKEVKTPFLSINNECKLLVKARGIAILNHILSLLFSMSTIIDNATPLMNVQPG